MADSASQVGAAIRRSLSASSTALGQAVKDGLKSGGKAARTELNLRAKDVPGGDRRFSNMRGYSHGGRLGVSVRTRGDEVEVSPKGPWKIAEVGASPHRQGRGLHPGTRSSQGRRSWTRGRDAVFVEVERSFVNDVGGAVERAFGGS